MKQYGKNHSICESVQKLNFKMRSRKMAFLRVCLFLVCLFAVFSYQSQKMNVVAKDSFIANYIQTIYDHKNGIGSNEAKCIYQSSSGYIWIGTDSGLYRTDGAGFQAINLWDTERDDVYSVNSIMQDTDGRIWIATDNYGLFYIEGGENYHLSDNYYEGLKSITEIFQADSGELYAATGNGLYQVVQESDGSFHLKAFENDILSRLDILDICEKNGDIWMVDGTSKVYVLRENGTVDYVDVTGNVNLEFACIANIGGKVYAGSTGSEIVSFRSKNNYEIQSVSVDHINNIVKTTEGKTFVCADNGIGYLDAKNNFFRITDCQIDTYISDLIQDYEGNYWISSTRMGVLLLSRSKFVDYNLLTGMQASMVNTVCSCMGYTYIGTDDGLILYDENMERVSNDLTEMLSGVSIRNLMVDRDKTVWISTYRRFGIVKYTANHEIVSYGRSNNIPNMMINQAIELSGGNILIATEGGLCSLSKDGVVSATNKAVDAIGERDITCVLESTDGRWFVGTDGDGIAIVNPNNGNCAFYTTDNGLNSNVITSIKQGEHGIWIGTDNGLCFYNESFRAISNVPVSDSIYDLVIDGDTIWILGSLGVVSADEENLLSSMFELPRFWNVSDGLSKDMNSVCHTCIDTKGILYVCCNTGICSLDTKNIKNNEIAPRIRVTAVDADGVTYEFDDLSEGLQIGHNVSRIAIDFAVFSYQNRANIEVQYSLKGFDENPIVIKGNEAMQAVYTNLDGGTYEFEIMAYNGDGTPCENRVAFVIEKQKSFFESLVVRIIFGVLLFGMLILVIWLVIYIRRQLHTKNYALEKLSKEHEEVVKTSSAKNDYLANMSNEIKTPVNAMMVKADEILQVLDPNDENREKISSIYNIGNNILQKVDDIILLAKIEAGRVEVVNSSYDIVALVYELAQEVVNKIDEKPIKFFVEIGEEFKEQLYGDAEKIKAIVSRLLDNAVKYTKEGSITLSVDYYEYANADSQDMINLVFTVSDTGIGIKEEKLESIFQVFNLTDSTASSVKSNTGVGLAIAKGYAGLMNGDIEVESAYGAGSTFILSLNQKMTDKHSGSNAINKIGENISKEDAEKMWLPDVHVLLVDCDDVSRGVAAKILSQFEMKIDQATSGVSAIDMVMNNTYDVVFMDLSMPIMNGLEAMQEIRELEGDKYSMLPIISMDSDAIEGNKEKLIGAGFTDSILKPLELRRVAAILKDCLPEEKIKERSTDIQIYIEGSRFSEGLLALKEYLDIETAIERIGGSIDVYNKLIVAYYNQQKTACEELAEKKDTDIRSFKTKLHTVRTGSMNIGAFTVSKEASWMEASINIGNRGYVSENFDEFAEHLAEIIAAVENYILFMQSVEGMTEEEYAAKTQKELANESENNIQYSDEMSTNEEQDAPVTISIQKLEDLKYIALDGEFEEAQSILDELLLVTYQGEDQEFMEVLSEAVKNKSIETINELITTYMDLKM